MVNAPILAQLVVSPPWSAIAAMPYTTLLLAICCAVFYYRLGEAEYSSGWLLALVSVILWVGGTFVFRFGWLGNLALQVLLFFGLSLWNMMRPPPR